MYRTTNSCFCVFAALLAVIATAHAFATPRSGLTSNRNRRATSLNVAIVARNGLQYEDIEIGTGRNVFKGDSVLCYYVGTYEKTETGGDIFSKFKKGGNTVTFDETQPGDPAEVVVGMGQVIQGWDIGICGDATLDIPPMKIGGDRKLVIPASLAYGEGGAGDGVIPPNMDLEFQIAIVNSERKDPGVSGSTKLKAFGGLVGFLVFMLLSLFVVSQNTDKLMSLISG